MALLQCGKMAVARTRSAARMLTTCLPTHTQKTRLAQRLPALGACRNVVNAESTGSVVQVGKQQHWTAFMNNGRERQLLVHVVNSVEEGDAEGVLRAMDEFWAHHFGMKGTDSWSVRKDVLDSTLREKMPEFCLELGTYCGYSSLRIAQNLPPNGLLVTIEVDPLFAAIATKVVEYAGLQHKVKCLIGSAETKLDSIGECLKKHQQSPTPRRLDFILCDHSKQRFVPDLDLLEKSGLAGPGTVVMGDTTHYPGGNESEALNLLSHFVGSEKFQVQQHINTNKDSAQGITVCEWQHLV